MNWNTKHFSTFIVVFLLLLTIDRPVSARQIEKKRHDRVLLIYDARQAFSLETVTNTLEIEGVYLGSASYCSQLVNQNKRKLSILCPDSLPALQSEFTYTNTSSIQNVSMYSNIYGNENFNALFVSNDPMDTLYNEVIRFWKNSGRPVDYIIASGNRMNRAIALRKRIEKTPSVVVRVGCDEGSIQNISWAENPALKTHGEFSLPYYNGLQLSPSKNGYRFSPDIISFNDVNKDHPKSFQAFPLELSDGQIEQFNFDSKMKKRFHFQNVNLALSKRGNLADFSGTESYIDCGKDKRYDLTNDFSMSVWFKARSFSIDNSIVGKGPGMTIKIRERKPTFTITGVNDFSAEVPDLETNQWYHLVACYTEQKSISIYLDGELVGYFTTTEKIEENDNSFIIGSNHWDQFFDGSLNNLLIWDRVLSAEEVNRLYTTTAKIPSLYVWVAVVCLFIVLCFLVWFYWPKINGHRKLKSTIQIQNTDPKTNRIELLGEFVVIDEKGNDISSYFSPKLRQIFLLILLHSDRNHRGITTSALTRIIWPGQSPQSVKNTRGTSIQKLRTILLNITGIQLVFESKRWRIVLNDAVFCDYILICNSIIEFRDTPNNQMQEKGLKDLLALILRGRMVPSMTVDWIRYYSNNYIDNIQSFCESMIIPLLEQEDYTTLQDIADALFINDSLSEVALRIKTISLIHQKKFALARTCYDEFILNYLSIYGEPFSVLFRDIVKEKLLFASNSSVPNDLLEKYSESKIQ